MRVDECEVWVTCEGEPLPEYDTRPEGDDGKILACFIPSDAGKVSVACYLFLLVFTDDKTRYSKLTLLKTKDEASVAYKDFEAWCFTQLGARIKILHSDAGGEYLSNELESYLRSRGTDRRLTPHDTPEYNGVAE